MGTAGALTRLFLLGPPSTDSGGGPQALAFERRSQLLAFLALRRSWVSRSELATLLWPEQESRLAYSNLRKTLFRVQSLEWTSGIDVQAGAVRFEPWTDVFAFETALRERRAAEALPMWRGDLLAGFEDDANEAWSSWLDFERNRLRVAWRGAALEHLAGDIEPAGAIDLSTRLLAADPLDEAALRAHMAWLERGGQAARAREVHREFLRRLQADLGLTPSAELVALAGAPGAEKPPADDGLVGRAMEMRRIAEQLGQADCRLLTLIGAGGAGKTRLAHRALRDLAPGFRDGVAFVALEDLASANALGARIAGALDLKLARGREPLEQAIEHLRERHVLLVLDNFEHLAAEASRLEQILGACAHVKILVTSRVRLAIAAEWTLPIEGLPCPEAEDHERVEAFDAARLFIKSARRVGTTVNAATEAAAIVDICQAVGGLPLALELAATWTRLLPCSAIATELRQGTELLRATDPAFPARHASIEAVFERSWQLLAASERDALARLSVFVGGFSAEAARVVAAASLPVLGSLADNSLLRRDGARMFLHPLVQELASVRLGAGEARSEAQKTHAHYYHRLLAQLRRTIDDGDRDALQFVDAEFENFRGAWRWAAAHDAALLETSAITLLYYVDHRRRIEEGLSLLHLALECAPVRENTAISALLVSASAHLEYRLDRYAEAESLARRALAMTRPESDHAARLQCYKTLGVCCLVLARYPEAREYLTLALRQSPASIDPRTAAAMLDNLSLVEKETGNHGEALNLALQSLEQHRRLGDQSGVALVLNNLGSKYMARREYETATQYLREALVLCDRHGLVGTRAYVLANFAEIAMFTGEHEAGAVHLRQAREIAEAIGNRALNAFLKVLGAMLALRRSDRVAARAHVADALADSLEIGRRNLQVECVVCFAELLLAEGEAAGARAVLRIAAADPAANALQLEVIDSMLARAPGPERASPALTFEELVHRIVAENPIAHAPLIATLRP